MDKHLPAIGPEGMSEKPACGSPGAVEKDLAYVDCQACLWSLHMVLSNQLAQVHARMRAVSGVTLRVKRSGG